MARDALNPRVSARGALTFDDVKALVRHLPAIVEEPSYGTRALKVRGKLLVRLKEDGETMVLRTTLLEREHLMSSEPRTFYITDHYRDYPSVLVRLANVDTGLLRQLMEDAWRRIAPRSVVKRFDESGVR